MPKKTKLEDLKLDEGLTYGKLIKRERLRQNLEQKALAKLASVDPAYISKLEANTPGKTPPNISVAALINISKALQVEPQYLIPDWVRDHEVSPETAVQKVTRLTFDAHNAKYSLIETDYHYKSPVLADKIVEFSADLPGSTHPQGAIGIFRIPETVRILRATDYVINIDHDMCWAGLYAQLLAVRQPQGEFFYLVGVMYRSY